ncbi:MAG: hypothetical protein HUK24_05625, partial [Sphaerochaetaceae bacterium]|nr:hypothetical protein [Sphaerochaetaceae bacterium]
MKKNISALFILFVMCFIFVSCTTTTGTLLFSPSYPLQEYEGYGEDDPFLISLKNDTYLRTSELFLLNDETIYLDSEGEVVTGLQMTLKDFGKSIKASGKANKATFKVLNEVQRAFGLEETDYVDEQVYLDLLPALLIYK